MKLKNLLLVVLLFLLYFIFYSISYSHSVSSDLEEKLFRLHIIANSNSEEDQDLKIYVRDCVVDYLNSFNFETKEQLISFISENKDELNSVVQEAISAKGYTYSSSIEIGNEFYPLKKYSNLILPSGNYDGMKIKIGNANGKNWWCVLFPPMCLIDESTCELSKDSKYLLENSISPETKSVISETSHPAYKFKFKIINFINNLN